MNRSLFKNRIVIPVSLSLFVISPTGSLFSQNEKKTKERTQDNIFDMPKKHIFLQRLMMFMTAASKQKNYRAMEKICVKGLKKLPENPNLKYKLACAQAMRGGAKDEALATLEDAVDLGFINANHIVNDIDLISLRDDPEFKKLVKKAQKLQHDAKTASKIRNAAATEPENSIAMVTETNTVWNPRFGVFVTNFKFPEKPDAGKEATKGKSAVLKKIQEWYKKGTAAGNHGDLYDNRDKDHSNMRYQNYPQLTRVEYCQAAKARNVDRGHAATLFFNAPTIGNASLAGHWSLPRLMMNQQGLVSLQYIKYMRNQMNIYPEHRDHDPIIGGGKGDTFAANTPYCIISQGSSGTDRPFLEAVVSTLAAFRPDTKQVLKKAGILMPTIQMIFRYNQNSVKTPEDYLTGKAHPSVFTKENINSMKMVKMAHDMKPDNVPPIVQLRVKEEDLPVTGKDFFDPVRSQVLFNTPSAIARIMRSVNHSFRIVVSAEKSKDINGKKLTYLWAVLRGDADRIKINKMNKEGSVVELIIPYHTRKPVLPGSKMESPRVDIALFVNNGKYYSAPGFVTMFFIDHEKRTYDKKKRIKTVDYVSNQSFYVDSMISGKKNWRDEYMYNKKGDMTGWKRHRGKEVEEFTAEGGLLVSRDKQARPLSARKVNYKIESSKNRRKTTVKQQNTDLILWYWYKNSTDNKGEVVTKAEYDKRMKKK